MIPIPLAETPEQNCVDEPQPGLIVEEELDQDGNEVVDDDDQGSDSQMMIEGHPFNNVLPIEVWIDISRYVESDPSDWFNLCKASPRIDGVMWVTRPLIVFRQKRMQAFSFISRYLPKSSLYRLRLLSSQFRSDIDKVIGEAYQLDFNDEPVPRHIIRIQTEQSVQLAMDVGVTSFCPLPFHLRFADYDFSGRGWLRAPFWGPVRNLILRIGRRIRHCVFSFHLASFCTETELMKVPLFLECLSNMPYLETLAVQLYDNYFGETFLLCDDQKVPKLEKLKCLHLRLGAWIKPCFQALIQRQSASLRELHAKKLADDETYSMPLLSSLRIQNNENIYSLSSKLASSPLRQIHLTPNLDEFPFDMARFLLSLQPFGDTLEELTIAQSLEHAIDPTLCFTQEDNCKFASQQYPQDMNSLLHLQLPNLKILELSGYRGPLAFLVFLPSLQSLSFRLVVPDYDKRLELGYANRGKIDKIRESMLDPRAAQPDLQFMWDWFPNLMKIRSFVFVHNWAMRHRFFRRFVWVRSN